MRAELLEDLKFIKISEKKVKTGFGGIIHLVLFRNFIVFCILLLMVSLLYFRF